MAHYYQIEARETYCEVCGELTLCDVLAADDREPDTGYLDELVLCPDCQREREGAPMRVHSKIAPAMTAGRT